MLKVKKKDSINNELATLIQSFLDYREEISDAKLKSIELVSDGDSYAIEYIYEDGDYNIVAVEDI